MVHHAGYAGGTGLIGGKDATGAPSRVLHALTAGTPDRAKTEAKL
jgi:hypothetical protein